MAATFNVGEAKTRLSELLARVEDGEHVVIARGNEPIAELRLIRGSRRLAEEAVARRRARRPVPALDPAEILAWRAP